jgi:hypothetical protein
VLRSHVDTPLALPSFGLRVWATETDFASVSQCTYLRNIVVRWGTYNIHEKDIYSQAVMAFQEGGATLHWQSGTRWSRIPYLPGHRGHPTHIIGCASARTPLRVSDAGPMSSMDVSGCVAYKITTCGDVPSAISYHWGIPPMHFTYSLGGLYQ